MNTLTAALLFIFFATSVYAESPAQKLQVVVEAARELNAISDENRPYLLVKTVTIRSAVGLIFGYADNEAACNEIASDLSQAAKSRGLGSPALFVCDAVY